jgi:hypothetical protein
MTERSTALFWFNDQSLRSTDDNRPSAAQKCYRRKLGRAALRVALFNHSTAQPMGRRGEMASKDKSGAKGVNRTGNDDAAQKSSAKDSGASVLYELEKTAESVGTEVKHLFDRLAEKVAHVAATAAETTATVAEKVTGKEPANLARSLPHEITAASEASLQVIADSFDRLRKRVLGDFDGGDKAKKGKKKAKKVAAESAPPPGAPAPEEAVAAGPSAEKAASEKPAKKTTKKKPTAKKAVAKPATPKKVVPEKATAKTTATKQAAPKKTATKKRAAAAAQQASAKSEPGATRRPRSKPKASAETTTPGAEGPSTKVAGEENT